MGGLAFLCAIIGVYVIVIWSINSDSVEKISEGLIGFKIDNSPPEISTEIVKKNKRW